MEGGVCEVKFFQVFTMIVMVLATVGVIGESGRGKQVYIALFAAAGVLHLASWVLSMMYF